MSQIVSFNLPPLTYIDEDDIPHTKTTVVYSDEKKQNIVVWVATDTVGIYPEAGSQVYFSLSGNAGGQSAEFDGGGWAFKGGMKYYSYYPFIGDIYLDRNHIPVSFEGQSQDGTTDIEHIGKYTYLKTAKTSAEDGMLTFSYEYMCCILRPNLTLPAGTYTKLAITIDDNLFVKKGYFDLMANGFEIVPEEMTNQILVDLKNVVLDKETTFRVHLVCSPVNLNGKEITISVLDNNGVERQCKKTPTSTYNRGAIAGYTCNSWTVVEQSMNLIVEDWNEGSETHGDLQ